MMDRKPVRNMRSSIPKINLRKLVHLVGFIIRIQLNYFTAHSMKLPAATTPTHATTEYFNIAHHAIFIHIYRHQQLNALHNAYL